MTLDARIHVACPDCLGTAGSWRIPCDGCLGTGRDGEAEARLAELAARLPEAAHEVRYRNRLSLNQRLQLARALDALAALLIGGGEAGV